MLLPGGDDRSEEAITPNAGRLKSGEGERTWADDCRCRWKLLLKRKRERKEVWFNNKDSMRSSFFFWGGEVKVKQGGGLGLFSKVCTQHHQYMQVPSVELVYSRALPSNRVLATLKHACFFLEERKVITGKKKEKRRNWKCVPKSAKRCVLPLAFLPRVLVLDQTAAVPRAAPRFAKKNELQIRRASRYFGQFRISGVINQSTTSVEPEKLNHWRRAKLFFSYISTI